MKTVEIVNELCELCMDKWGKAPCYGSGIVNDMPEVGIELPDGTTFRSGANSYYRAAEGAVLQALKYVRGKHSNRKMAYPDLTRN